MVIHQASYRGSDAPMNEPNDNVGGLVANKGRRKKIWRYLRWASKGVFLILFVVPVAYLSGAPQASVYSFLLGGLALTKTYAMVPLTQSVCSVWTSSFGNTNPGGWVLCPVGAAQIMVTGDFTIGVIVAMFLFLIPIFILGNFFCSWVCPIGTMVDSFDKGVEKFLPKIEAKRAKRAQVRWQNKSDEHGKHGSSIVCPSCPLGKVLSKKPGVLANGVLASALVGSAVLKFPVFCTVCPIGISQRGMIHLNSIASVTGAILPWIIELWVIPIVAVVASLRERRFWCKKLCPVGALLKGASAINPFIKPKIREDKCVQKGCPEDCKDGHIDLCLHCRIMDNRKCEKVCPFDINLLDHDSLARCTKCLECYMVCEYDAIKIDLVGKPEILRIGNFFKRLRKRRRKDNDAPQKNPSIVAR
jgi:ferredoxin-type protein NapH